MKKVLLFVLISSSQTLMANELVNVHRSQSLFCRGTVMGYNKQMVSAVITVGEKKESDSEEYVSKIKLTVGNDVLTGRLDTTTKTYSDRVMLVSDSAKINFSGKVNIDFSTLTVALTGQAVGDSSKFELFSAHDSQFQCVVLNQ